MDHPEYAPGTLMTVLGIDPGIERMGYGVVDFTPGRIQAVSYGIISTKKTEPKPARFRQIWDDLNELLLKHHPGLLSVEKLIFAKNVTTAMTVSEARGIVILAAELHQIPVVEYTPLEIKRTVSGSGRADKSQVERAVQILLSLSEIPKPDDVSDALAIALCGGTRYRGITAKD